MPYDTKDAAKLIHLLHMTRRPAPVRLAPNARLRDPDMGLYPDKTHRITATLLAFPEEEILLCFDRTKKKKEVQDSRVRCSIVHAKKERSWSVGEVLDSRLMALPVQNSTMALLARPPVIRYLHESESLVKTAVAKYLSPSSWSISWCQPHYHSLVYLPYSDLWSREDFIYMEASL